MARMVSTALLMLAVIATPTRAETVGSCARTPQRAADAYDYVLGTQAIGGHYQLGSGNGLLEQAAQVRTLGSNVLKISLARGAAGNYGTARSASEARTTLDYIEGAPEIQQALEMDFTYYQAWVHTFTGGNWRDGVSKAEARAYYDEMFALSAWLLKRYSGTGKVFMLGNWEGDWLLNGRQGGDATPPPKAIEGMAAWLNIRQKAIDDAKAQVQHHDVGLYQYVEVNLVKRAMQGKPSVALSVLPLTDVDLVSYSSYESIKQAPEPDVAAIRQPLADVLNFIEARLKPKPGLPFARRVFIGEYGYHADRKKPLSVEQQYLRSRNVMQVAIEQDLPFALIWQMYNNEYADDGTSHEMSLIDESGSRRALYYLHRTFLRDMRDFVADSCRRSGKVPTRAAFKARALELLPTLSFDKMGRLASD